MSDERDVVQDFEAWASVSVQLIHRTDDQVTAILDRLGLRATWPASDEKWSRVLARDISNGALERVERYAEICAAELRQRRESEPRDEDGVRPFAEQMGGAGPAPTPPGEDQQRTAAVELAAARQAIQAVRAASEWTLERYAQYCAEVYEFPDRAEAVHVRYGLADPNARRHANESWTHRLSADRALYDRWTRLVAAARAELKKG